MEIGKERDMSEQQEPEGFSVVLFSGTDDKLTAASILIAGAAALGKRVDVLLQYWALEACQADRITKDHGLAAEAGSEGSAALWRASERRGHQHWSDTLRQAKEVGEVRVHACANSMEIFGLDMEDMDPIVDDVVGVATFLVSADGQVVFI
jgi:peroxiredoxin family protein